MLVKRLEPDAFGTAADIMRRAARHAPRVSEESLDAIRSEYFLSVLQCYIDGKDWQSFSPLPLQRKLAQGSSPATVRLNALRDDVRRKEGLTLSDVRVMRDKIESAEYALKAARTAVAPLHPRVEEFDARVEELTSHKEKLQQQLHDHLVLHHDVVVSDAFSGGGDGNKGTGRDSGAPTAIAATVLRRDVQDFTARVGETTRKLAAARVELAAARALLAPAQLDLDEALQRRNALHAQLLLMIEHKERDRQERMTAWIEQQRLEFNFGEYEDSDATEDDEDDDDDDDVDVDVERVNKDEE